MCFTLEIFSLVFSFISDPPRVDRENKPKIAPRVDRTKKPSATLPPRCRPEFPSFDTDEQGDTEYGMSSSINYKLPKFSNTNIAPPTYPTNQHVIHGQMSNSRKTSSHSSVTPPSPNRSQSSLSDGVYENSMMDGDDDAFLEGVQERGYESFREEKVMC